jgi:hypothetical protein
MTLETLKKKYTEQELKDAVAVIHGTDDGRKLLKKNEKLSNFLIDRSLQETLYQWIEEQAVADL